MFNGEATNTNFIVFDLSWPGFKPLCIRPTYWVFIMLVHWNNSLLIDMLLYSYTLSWFPAKLYFFTYNLLLRGSLNGCALYITVCYTSPSMVFSVLALTRNVH